MTPGILIYMWESYSMEKSEKYIFLALNESKNLQTYVPGQVWCEMSSKERIKHFSL